MTIVGYASKGPRGLLERFEYEPPGLAPHEVEISVTHCGVSRTDLHLIDDDWGISEYPLVPGHEIIGLVAESGDAVRDLEKGRRVGVGWQCSACFRCEFCLAGDDNFCADQQTTCLGRFGGFADALRVDSRFVFPIPDNLDSANTAPLMCGGLAVYAPLTRATGKPSMKVGIIGLGGLGHLAVQFANAFGWEVTVLSTTPAKENEARLFGADWFIDLNDSAALKTAAGAFDFLLSTVPVEADWRKLLATLRPKGTLCFVGASPGVLGLSPFSLIVGGRAVLGSATGNRSQMKEMLAFAARHGIEARTEIFPMNQVNEALARLRENRVRYRLVLKN